MRVACRLVLICATFAAPALGQDDSKARQLQKMYDDALAQLRSVQDRRNELARENETLTARVKALETEVATSQEELSHFKAASATAAERTFYLRAHYAAWQAFLQRHPDLLVKWRSYLGNSLVLPTSESADDAWPFDMAG